MKLYFKFYKMNIIIQDLDKDAEAHVNELKNMLEITTTSKLVLRLIYDFKRLHDEKIRIQEKNSEMKRLFWRMQRVNQEKIDLVQEGKELENDLEKIIDTL